MSMKLYLREASLLSRLHHPNVVRFYGVSFDDEILNEAKTLHIVTEFCPQSLGSILRPPAPSTSPSKSPPPKGGKMGKGVAKGGAKGVGKGVGAGGGRGVATEGTVDGGETNGGGGGGGESPSSSGGGVSQAPSPVSSPPTPPVSAAALPLWTQLTRARKYQISLQIAQGLRFLHARNIVHRDLKPDNVLLDEYGIVKICDFGMARLQENKQKMTADIGTPAYMAVEVAAGDDKEAYGTKVDVFSFGVLLWTIWSGREPYGELASKPFKLVALVQQGLRPSITREDSPDIPTALIPLMQRCWAGAPAHRPDMDAIVSAFTAITKETGYDLITPTKPPRPSSSGGEGSIIGGGGQMAGFGRFGGGGDGGSDGGSGGGGGWGGGGAPVTHHASSTNTNTVPVALQRYTPRRDETMFPDPAPPGMGSAQGAGGRGTGGKGGGGGGSVKNRTEGEESREAKVGGGGRGESGRRQSHHKRHGTYG
jgi:serine/threonine protein kinase